MIEKGVEIISQNEKLKCNTKTTKINAIVGDNSFFVSFIVKRKHLGKILI